MHSLSHVTGGGIAANLARVLPVGSWVEVDRSTWEPLPVFRVLADMAGTPIEDTEGTWNLGIGMFAVVAAGGRAEVIASLGAAGMRVVAGRRVVDVRARPRPGSSRAPRASTAAPCGSSGAYAG